MFTAITSNLRPYRYHLVGREDGFVFSEHPVAFTCFLYSDAFVGQLNMTPNSVFTVSCLVLFATLFSSCINVVLGNPRNPCHPGRRYLGEGNTCKVYRVPPRLCRKCMLNETNINPTGKFLDCTNIYNIIDPECRVELQRYAKWNKCDALRNQQVAAFEENIVPLDYFVYSICEECCDCVSTGAKESQYWRRRRDQTLFQTAERPNCGTHAAADMCSVWPNVRAVVNWYNELPSYEEVEALPEVCPILKTWRQLRIQSDSLSEEERNTVPEEAQPFLKNFTRIARCSARPVWQACIRLESSQSRI